jgi:hypothetical protein
MNITQALQALIGYGTLSASSLCLQDLRALRLQSLDFLTFVLYGVCSGNSMVLALFGRSTTVL